MAERTAEVKRDTLETQIQVRLNLDGSGQSAFQTGVPFLDHMLDQIARHGLIDMDVQANGDLHIDAHHTVEDIGITLGQAVSQALGIRVTDLPLTPERVLRLIRERDQRNGHDGAGARQVGRRARRTRWR